MFAVEATLRLFEARVNSNCGTRGAEVINILTTMKAKFMNKNGTNLAITKSTIVKLWLQYNLKLHLPKKSGFLFSQTTLTIFTVWIVEIH